jgi:hypothetical protein
MVLSDAGDKDGAMDADGFARLPLAELTVLLS